VAGEREVKQGLNKAILIGNLGAEPELKHTANGQAVMRLRLACSESWKDRDGQRKERTEWLTVTMWGPRAEALSRMLRKGEPVYVEGRIQTREWQDKDGNKRTSTEINATELLFLGGGRGEGGQRSQSQNRAADDFPPSSGGEFDDDVPFMKLDERCH
jgi:single-strand DNA-binding protein